MAVSPVSPFQKMALEGRVPTPSVPAVPVHPVQPKLQSQSGVPPMSAAELSWSPRRLALGMSRVPVLAFTGRAEEAAAESVSDQIRTLLAKQHGQLTQLAESYGVIDYEDYAYQGGHPQAVEALTDKKIQTQRWETYHRSVRQLLANMGILSTAEASLDEIHKALVNRQREIWTKPLNPVRVTRDEECRLNGLSEKFADQGLSPTDMRLELMVPTPLLEASSDVPVMVSFTQEGATQPTWVEALDLGDAVEVDEPVSTEPLNHWTDPDTGESYARVILGVPLDTNLPGRNEGMPLGYHQLNVEIGEGPNALSSRQNFIVVPDKAYVPPRLQGEGNEHKVWGPAVQLYALNSDDSHDWGIGDFSHLADVAKWSHQQGAALVGINPLSVLNPSEPEKASPYNPVSRMFINSTYIDVEATPEFQGLNRSARRRALIESVKQQLANDIVAHAEAHDDESWSNHQNVVRYSPVVKAKMNILRHGFVETLDKEFVRKAKANYVGFINEDWFHATPRAREFRGFISQMEAQGIPLRQYATFAAIQQRFDGYGWPAWDDERWKSLVTETDRRQYYDLVEALIPKAEERKDFYRDVRFYEYLQFVALEQLEQVKKVFQGDADQSGSLGLYLDLPVGSNGGGFDTLLHEDLYMKNTDIGAPPDDLGPEGQSWGFPPMIPHKLEQAGYKPLVELLRANMKDAGVLRIDHFALVNRLFVIPQDEEKSFKKRDGVYIDYNMDDVMGIIALESQRNKTLIIGEDLGTVPAEVTTGMEGRDIYSYKVARWERDWANKEAGQPYFSPDDPEKYPGQSIAAFSTHDTSTLNGLPGGWFHDRRVMLGLINQATSKGLIEGDRAAIRQLVKQLGEMNLIEPQKPIDVEGVIAGNETAVNNFVEAAHRFIAQTGSKVALVQFEDLLGLQEQVNLPGSNDGPIPQAVADPTETPIDINWRRRLPVTVNDLLNHPNVQAVAKIFREARPAPVPTRGWFA